MAKSYLSTSVEILAAKTSLPFSTSSEAKYLMISFESCDASSYVSKITCFISLFFLNFFSYSLLKFDSSINSKFSPGFISLKES